MHEGLVVVAREFIAYYTKGGGCSNCGGLPHTTTCFVGRFERALTVNSQVISADDFEHLALMGMTPDGRYRVGNGGAKRVLAQAKRLVQAEVASHRCSGCGHRWDGPLVGAALCGDCWRTAQPVVHAARGEDE